MAQMVGGCGLCRMPVRQRNKSIRYWGIPYYIDGHQRCVFLPHAHLWKQGIHCRSKMGKLSPLEIKDGYKKTNTHL